MKLDAKQSSKTINGVNVTKFDRGTIFIDKGRQLLALALKCTFPIKNTTGGNAAMADQQKQELLNLFQITVTIGKGAGNLMKPYIANTLKRINIEMRRFLNAEIDLYSDTTTGLQQTITNNATNNSVCYILIPLGQAWFLRGKFKDLWGLGPSLVSLLQLEVKCTATNLEAGWDLNGNVTFDLFPVTVPAKADLFGPIPVFEESSEVNKSFFHDQGLLLALDEGTNAQSSNPFTSISLKMDDTQIYSQLAAKDIAVGWDMASLLNANGLVTNRESILYQVTDGETDFPDMPVGKPTFTKDVNDLATVAAKWIYVPVLTHEAMALELDYIAKNVRNDTIKAVSVADADGLNIGDDHRPFVGYYLFSPADKEFEMYSGLVAYPDARQPEVLTPKSLLDAAKAKQAMHTKNGEHIAAASVSQAVARMVPGAVESTKGFKANSAVLNAVRTHFT